MPISNIFKAAQISKRDFAKDLPQAMDSISFRLFDLPRELRENIYLQYFLLTPACQICTPKHRGLYDSYYERPPLSYLQPSSLLQASKQIYNEALPIFHDYTPFVLTMKSGWIYFQKWTRHISLTAWKPPMWFEKIRYLEIYILWRYEHNMTDELVQFVTTMEMARTVSHALRRSTNLQELKVFMQQRPLSDDDTEVMYCCKALGEVTRPLRSLSGIPNVTFGFLGATSKQNDVDIPKLTKCLANPNLLEMRWLGLIEEARSLGIVKKCRRGLYFNWKYAVKENWQLFTRWENNLLYAIRTRRNQIVSGSSDSDDDSDSYSDSDLDSDSDFDSDW